MYNKSDFIPQQIVANVREDEDDEYAKLQARVVPKFLIEMEQRAMERNRKHQEAKDRREQLEKEKEEMRLAAEEANVLKIILPQSTPIFCMHFSVCKTKKPNANVSKSCARNGAKRNWRKFKRRTKDSDKLKIIRKLLLSIVTCCCHALE